MANRRRRERRAFIQALLRLALYASVVLMTIGELVWIASGRSAAEPVKPGMLLGPLDMGERLMLAGIILLAVTPMLRVMALLGLWIRERAWRFAATAAIVLLLLATGLWAGGG